MENSGSAVTMLPKPTRKDTASFPSITLTDHSKAWASKDLGTIAPQALVESGCLHTLVKLSLNAPVPPLLYFVVDVTAISYFQRSVERSAAKIMETPMTVGEKCEKQKGREKKRKLWKNKLVISVIDLLTMREGWLFHLLLAYVYFLSFPSPQNLCQLSNRSPSV